MRVALDQHRTPYFQALLEYVDSGVLPFHTPGHVQGNGMDLAFREFVGDNICAIDLTPMPGIDDLLQPTESIKEAQQLAAEAWGADNTFFLINGSTSGNQCMMMTALNPGEKVAVPRNSHKSMLGGLIMSGAEPIYMQPEVDEELRMDHCVTPETVSATLQQHPDVAAIYLVSPTYYGVAADLESIERIAHDAGKLLLVDEAWGPHFHFHPALPLSATSAGADLCVNSTHKMLSAFSQCAMLHQKGERVRLDRLASVLKMFLSTSPNLPMVASLDVARKQMATEGERLLSRTIELAQAARNRINEIEGLYCFGEELRGRKGIFALDPTKITVTVTGLGYTGYEASEILRRRHNIQVELADLFNVVALFTIGTTEDAADSPRTGFPRDGARRSKGRYVRAIRNSRAAIAARKFPSSARPANANASTRSFSRSRRVRKVSRIGWAHLRGNANAVSARHTRHRTRRRDHARDRRLRAPGVEGGRAHSRTVRRRAARNTRREGVSARPGK